MKEKPQEFKTGLEAYEKPIIEIIYIGDNSILTSEVCIDTICSDDCPTDNDCFGYNPGGLCGGYNPCPVDCPSDGIACDAADNCGGYNPCPGDCPSDGFACDTADGCGSDGCFGYDPGGLCSGYSGPCTEDCTGDGPVCCDGVN